MYSDYEALRHSFWNNRMFDHKDWYFTLQGLLEESNLPLFFVICKLVGVEFNWSFISTQISTKS